MMDYVWPQNLYSHSRTCTHSSLCRRLSILVAFPICYLLDYASVHEISTLVTWFQCMSDIFSHYGDLDPLYIFIFYEDHDPLYIFIMEILIYLYCTWWWPHISYFVSCLFMAIVLLCIRDCCMYLQSYAEIFVLYWWMAGSSTWFFINRLMWWTYNVFRPSYNPFDLTH